jgi:hypothetical protein
VEGVGASEHLNLKQKGLEVVISFGCLMRLELVSNLFVHYLDNLEAEQGDVVLENFGVKRVLALQETELY